MPFWAWTVQLAIGLLRDIVPEIEKAIVTATGSGVDPSPHVAAHEALMQSINTLNQALAAVSPKS